MRYLLTGFTLFLLSVLTLLSAIGQKAAYRANIDADGIKRVEILAGAYFFDPDHIVVKVDTPLELKVRKEPGIVPHNFIIKEPEAGLDISDSLSTEPKVIRVTPKKTGKYPFYCDKKFLFFESHRKKGMEGFIEVTE